VKWIQQQKTHTNWWADVAQMTFFHLVNGCYLRIKRVKFEKGTFLKT
jgi:hypothetical protein